MVQVPTLSAVAHRLTRPRFPAPTPAGEPAYGLPAAPATRYRARLAALTPADRTRVTNTIEATGEPARRYLRRAFAAGQTPAAIERLKAAWATHDPDWLRENVGRFDPPEPGPLRHHAGRLKQCDRRTCGPAAVVAARMLVDPAYAYELATRPAAAFGAAQVVVHRAANVVWPRAFGTTPGGVAATLNVHSGAFGARYGWRPVDPGRPDPARAALDAATRSAAHGWPVPLLIGRWEPRHWVLVVGVADDTRSGDDMLCYEPGQGRIVPITAEAVATGGAGPLGWPRLHAVVLPVTPLR